MNPHIELVKKWLADPESVSSEELEAAEAAAEADYMAADWAAWADWPDRYVYWGATWAAAGARAASAAYWADESADATYGAAYYRNKAIKYVKEYEELNK